MLTCAFVGLGSRGSTYAELMMQFSDRIKVVACADTDPVRLKQFAERFHITVSSCFASADEFFAQPKLADIVAVCTQDRQHASMACAAMQKGYHVLCEKPVSPFVEECLDVARVSRETGREVIVCHVLRYSNFFRSIKRVIDSGEIGRVMAIEANEKVAYWHQAHSFVRGSWSNSKETSPMILSKSCHDMDILLWLTGKHCISVNSIGSLSHFRADQAPEGIPERCSSDCPIYGKCPWNIDEAYLNKARKGSFGWPVNVVTKLCNMDDLEQSLAEGPYGRCVYHCDNDVVDHQQTLLNLEDDVTISFTMSAFTSRHGRRLYIMGTAGDMVGELDEGTLTVTCFGKEPYVIDTKLSLTEQYAHGGGDMGLVIDLINVLSGDVQPGCAVTSIQDSVESHIVALAAEQSRLNGGETVKIADFIAGK